MIDVGSITEIFATYKKYGWILRRVLLSDELKKSQGKDLALVLGDVPIVNSETDAAWFSRPPKSGGVAWEIRYLGEPPFALLEHLDEDYPEFEASLAAVEARLHGSVVAKRSA